MSRMFVAALATVAFTASAFTAPAFAQATKDPAKIDAGSYVADSDHTQVLFGVNHLGFSTYFGRFSQITGKLALAPKDLGESAVEITFPTATVSTTSAKLDGELKGSDWFDAARFPNVTFRSTAVRPTGADSAQVTGDLTLHGVTHPVTLAVTLNGGGPNPFFRVLTVGFQATGSLKRSDFGVKRYLPTIGDEVSITISAAFVKP